MGKWLDALKRQEQPEQFPIAVMPAPRKDAEDLRMEYEERAALLEYDLGFMRSHAEAIARAMVYPASRQSGENP